MDARGEQLVRDSWAQLAPVRDSMVAAFYNRLFETNPGLRSLFQHADMPEQRSKFASMVNEIVRVIDKPDRLADEVAASGRRHVGYGVQERDYDDVGAALIWAITEALGPDAAIEVIAAWREAYALLAQSMKRAARR